MGSIVSNFNSSNVPDPITGITPKEKKLVRGNWAIVQKNPVENGVELFMTLFKNKPEYLELFPFREVPMEELREHKLLQIHSTSVMYALNSIIESLDNSEVLVNLLVKNGLTHGEKGVPEQGYWDLKDTLIEILGNLLGPKFTPECSEAWAKVLDVAFKVAVEHLNLAEDEEEEEGAEDEGEEVEGEAEGEAETETATEPAE